MQQVEQKLDDLLVKNAPVHLPEEAKKMIGQLMPWVTLIGGVLSVAGAWVLFSSINAVSYLGGIADDAARMYGYGYTSAGRGLVFIVWISIALLVTQAVLHFMAFPALRLLKKSGWRLLMYANLLWLVYNIVYFFYLMDVMNLIFSLIGSLAGLFILFQVRGLYSDAGTPIAAPPSAPAAPSTPSEPASTTTTPPKKV